MADSAPSLPLYSSRSFALAQTDLLNAWPLFSLGVAWSYTLVILSALFVVQVGLQAAPYALLLGGVLAMAWERLHPALLQDLTLSQRGSAILLLLTVFTGILQAVQDSSHNNTVIFIAWASLPVLYRLGRLGRQALQTSPSQTAYLNGIILGGFSSPFLASWLGVEHILWITPLSLILGLMALVRRKDARPSAPSAPASPHETLLDLLRQPYLASLFGLVSVGWALAWVVEVLMLHNLEGHYPSDPWLVVAILGPALGGVALVLGLWTTLQQRLSTAYRLGAQLAAYWLIIGMALVGAFLLALGIEAEAILLMGVVLLLRGLVTITTTRLFVPLQERLIQPLRTPQQMLLKTELEAWVFGIGLLLAGIGLWGVQILLDGDLPLLLALAIGLALVGAGITFYVHRGYQHLIQQAIEGRRITQQILASDPSTLAILRGRLKSPHAGEAIYALEALQQLEGEAANGYLADLLSHPTAEVRQDALRRLTLTQQPIHAKLLLILTESEDEQAPVREAALRLLASRSTPQEAYAHLSPYVTHSLPELRRGALVGLLNHAEGAELSDTEKILLSLTRSENAEERAFAAEVLGEVENKRFSSYLLTLLNDSEIAVQRAAILAAGKRNDPRYWPLVVPKLGVSALASVTNTALFLANKSVYPTLEAVLNQPHPNNDLMFRIARICGRRRDPQALELLKSQFNYPDPTVRSQVWVSLGQCGYQAQTETEVAQIHQAIHTETAYATWIIAALVDFRDLPALDNLRSALMNALKLSQTHLLLLLGFVHDPSVIGPIRYHLTSPIAEKRTLAIKALYGLLNMQQRSTVLPILEEGPLPERLERLRREFPQTPLSPAGRLAALLEQPTGRLPLWPRVLALHALPDSAPPNALALANHYLDSFDPILRETALMSLARLDERNFRTRVPDYFAQTQPILARLLAQLSAGSQPMLLTLEKVLILKSIGIFSRLPDPILIEVAALLEEMELEANQELFHEGDPGTAMYIIVSGKLRIMAGGKVIAERRDREFIGEMSLFDDEPRSASAQAAKDSKLLQLNQDAFMELMANHPDMALGVIRVLSTRLRQSMQQKGISPIMADIYEKLTDLPDDISYKGLSA